MQFYPGHLKVVLKPDPAFIPKVFNLSCRPIELLAFNPPHFTSPEQEQLNAICPVRALHAYVDKKAVLENGSAVCF